MMSSSDTNVYIVADVYLLPFSIQEESRRWEFFIFWPFFVVGGCSSGFLEIVDPIAFANDTS